MKKFDFFGVVFRSANFARHTYNIIQTMQRANKSAGEGQEMMSLILSTLKSLCNDTRSGLFWQMICFII